MTQEKPSFIKIVPGAKVDGLKMLNNTFVGDTDVINNQGELKGAVLEGNRHVVPPPRNEDPRLNKVPKSFNWTKWGTIATIIFGLIGILFFFLQKPTSQQEIIDSPGSINTIGQTGGTNITVSEFNSKPAVGIRKIVVLNEKTDAGYKHAYILGLSNPTNSEIKIAAHAAAGVNFKILDFKWESSQLLYGDGKVTTTLRAEVVTDKQIRASDVDFVVDEK